MLLLPERRIQGKEHPNPDLLFYKLLYQAISRARVKLCVLVVENYKLFSDILNIKLICYPDINIKKIIQIQHCQ